MSERRASVEEGAILLFEDLVREMRLQNYLLCEILERLPKPVYPQTTGLSITVRN